MKQQSAVDIYENKSRELIHLYFSDEIDRREFLTRHHNIYYDINKMFEQQILDAFSEGALDGLWGEGSLNKEEYFSETYGSKGSNDKYVCYKCKNLTDNKFEVCNECNVGFTSSQTEISDEEIEKSAKEWYEEEGWVNYNAEKRAWVSACKWYREQIKKK